MSDFPNFLRTDAAAWSWARKNVDLAIDSPEDGRQLRNQAALYAQFAREVLRDGSLTVYRMVCVVGTEAIQTHNLGKAWSKEEGAAGCYGNQGPPGSKPILIEGVVQASDIDWAYGFTSFMYYGESQWEVSMDENAPVKIISLTTDDGRRQVFSPTVAGNTGHAQEQWESMSREGRRAHAPTRQADPYRNEAHDVEQAKEYLRESFDFDGALNESHTMMPVQEILTWDDYGSWGQWSPGELLTLSPDELQRELTQYRGPQWAGLAMRWLNEGIPAVVLASTRVGSSVADGRGRVSLAVGMAIQTLPVIVLNESDDPDASEAAAPSSTIQYVDQGLSPLSEEGAPAAIPPENLYASTSRVYRAALVDSSAPPSPDETYFVDRPRIVRTKNGRTLKKPITYVIPGAAPGTVAFVDWHPMSDGGRYIDYMRTRPSLQHHGLGTQLIDAFYQDAESQGVKVIYWGKVMSEHAWAIMQNMQKAYPSINTTGKHYF